MTVKVKKSDGSECFAKVTQINPDGSAVLDLGGGQQKTVPFHDQLTLMKMA